jgi:hypothetical protein
MPALSTPRPFSRLLDVLDPPHPDNDEPLDSGLLVDPEGVERPTPAGGGVQPTMPTAAGGGVQQALPAVGGNIDAFSKYDNMLIDIDPLHASGSSRLADQGGVEMPAVGGDLGGSSTIADMLLDFNPQHDDSSSGLLMDQGGAGMPVAACGGVQHAMPRAGGDPCSFHNMMSDFGPHHHPDSNHLLI